MEDLTNLGQPPEGDGDSDEALMTRYITTGDELAFEAMYERYRDELSIFARNHLDGALAADADDMLQQAFFELHCSRDKLLPGTEIRPLLYRIVEYHCNDCIRAAEAKKRDYRLTCPLLESDADPKADPANQDLKMYVDELLGTLTPKQAEAMRLVWIEEHTAKSAAELLGLPPTTIRKRVKDALASLRS
jgi:RNA polymerase sigma-70 factor, ECF subfamily